MNLDYEKMREAAEKELGELDAELHELQRKRSGLVKVIEGLNLVVNPPLELS